MNRPALILFDQPQFDQIMDTLNVTAQSAGEFAQTYGPAAQELIQQSPTPFSEAGKECARRLEIERFALILPDAKPTLALCPAARRAEFQSGFIEIVSVLMTASAS